MRKSIFDCNTRTTKYIDLTEIELTQEEQKRLAQEEQAQLDLLKPSVEEVEQAEFELKTLTLLSEVGVI